MKKTDRFDKNADKSKFINLPVKQVALLGKVSARSQWIKNGMRRFQNHLSSKFILLTLLLLVLVVAAITSINVILSSATLREISQTNNEVYISNNLELIDNMLMDMSRVSLMTFSDPETQRILQEYRNSDYKEQLGYEDYLHSLFSNLISIREEVGGVYIFDTESLIFEYDINRVTRRSEVLLDNQPWLTQIADSAYRRIKGCVLTGAREPDYMFPGSHMSAFKRNYISVAREINSFSPFERIGYIMLLSPVSKIAGILEANNRGAISILVDEEDNIVYEPSGKYLGQPLSSYDKRLSIGGSEFIHLEMSIQDVESLVSYGSSENSGWSLLTIRSLDDVLANSIYLEKVSITTACAAFVIALILAIITGRRIARPVKTLSDAMIQVKDGNYDAKVEVESQDEIGQLSEVYNLMIDRIRYLIVDKYQVKTKLQEAELLQTKTELQYLRNQINPHFLYNTLDTIRFSAAVNNDIEVSEMIYKLANFFRLNTKKKSELIEINEEIAMIKSYFTLMKIRYKKLHDFYEIEPDLGNQLMPSFILQPIVENSILHGLKDKKYEGSIRISVVRSDHDLYDCKIKISDDGNGMNQEDLDCLNSTECQDIFEEQEQGHIGINNVKKRLALYYDNDYQISFSNNDQGGVTVEIYLRLLE